VDSERANQLFKVKNIKEILGNASAVGGLDVKSIAGDINLADNDHIKVPSIRRPADLVEVFKEVSESMHTVKVEVNHLRNELLPRFEGLNQYIFHLGGEEPFLLGQGKRHEHIAFAQLIEDLHFFNRGEKFVKDMLKSSDAFPLQNTPAQAHRFHQESAALPTVPSREGGIFPQGFFPEAPGFERGSILRTFAELAEDMPETLINLVIGYENHLQEAKNLREFEVVC